ncbi:MAG TPA: hypothetical protein VLC93_07785 [Myxococcota bacterium]|nr:hypothetical protein [Myxococcota bacterium]
MELNPESHITPIDAELIAKGLMAVARADGKLHEREAMMIRMFYADAGDSGVSTVANLERETPIDPAMLASGMGKGDVATVFLKSAFLVAYADNDCAKTERALIEKFSDALGYSRDQLLLIENSVKEHLLQQLTHVKNVEAVAQVAHELKL